MPLTLDDRRLLPPGIHDATPEEVEALFGRFQRTDRRFKLAAKLSRYVRELKLTGWACSVLIDGSFVMAPIDEPNDIDVILVMPEGWDLTAELRPFEYNLVSKRRTRQEYEIEVYAVRPGSVEEQAYITLFTQVRARWCQQFQWPIDSQKGLVRVVP